MMNFHQGEVENKKSREEKLRIIVQKSDELSH